VRSIVIYIVSALHCTARQYTVLCCTALHSRAVTARAPGVNQTAALCTSVTGFGWVCCNPTIENHDAFLPKNILIGLIPEDPLEPILFGSLAPPQFLRGLISLFHSQPPAGAGAQFVLPVCQLATSRTQTYATVGIPQLECTAVSALYSGLTHVGEPVSLTELDGTIAPQLLVSRRHNMSCCSAQPQ
jgi:hypothetical protein